MATPAHPQVMAPKTPGATRTAPPMKARPNSRMRIYTLFGLTGFVYMLVAFVSLEIVQALGEGPEGWATMQQRLMHPAYVIFHVLGLASVCFVAVRFFRLFPKAQLARLGPAKPPPPAVIHAGLYAAWIGVTLVFSLILAGVILR